MFEAAVPRAQLYSQVPDRQTPLSFEAFCATASVSRETGKRLKTYFVLLQKWQRTINLVGETTLNDPWRRHFLDSSQLHAIILKELNRRDGKLGDGAEYTAPVLVDFGSGAGFPGLVLAILGGLEVHLIEANGRKCAFLREVARATDTNISVHNARIESLDPVAKFGPGLAECVTARACASLDQLLTFANSFLSRNGFCAFLKGAGAREELTQAQKSWNIDCELLSSESEAAGTILKIREFRGHGP